MAKKEKSLDELKAKWTKQEQKQKLQELKKQRIMDAVDRMIADRAPKNGQTLAHYSGITTWESSMLFEELYGTTVSKWFKMMKANDNPFETEDPIDEEY